MPSVKGYGFTRTSPTLTEAPRLFIGPGPAKQALARWLEGELFEGALDDDEGVQNLRCVKRPERRASDMELVEIEVVVRTFDEAQLRRL